jgi:hypothetical protein
MSTRYFLGIKEINKYLVDMILINSRHCIGDVLLMFYIFLNFLNFFVWCASPCQAVRAVSKKRPKLPMLDIAFEGNLAV